jgi:hypothetical protein
MQHKTSRNPETKTEQTGKNARLRLLGEICKKEWTKSRKSCIITRLIFALPLFSGCSPVFHWTFGVHEKRSGGSAFRIPG